MPRTYPPSRLRMDDFDALTQGILVAKGRGMFHLSSRLQGIISLLWVYA